MAIEGYTYDSFEAFDRQWEKENAAKIALETGRIDWDNLTPENTGAVIIAATVGSVCNILQNLTGGKTR